MDASCRENVIGSSGFRTSNSAETMGGWATAELTFRIGLTGCDEGAVGVVGR